MRLLGLILAGGRSSRFGSEKAMASLDGQPLIARAFGVLAPCDRVAVSAAPASGAARWAQALDVTVLSDPPGAPDGPLSGLREGLRWACAQGADLLAVVPCDTPNLPPDLIETLRAALTDSAAVALAETADGLQPLVGLWRCTPALAALEDLMRDGDHPPVRSLLAPLNGVRVRFEDAAQFANANRPEDLAH
jgi:molybdopterin-guanine dinucleotide biosynthesis protein A